MKSNFLTIALLSGILFISACDDQGDPVTVSIPSPTLISISPDSGAVGDTVMITGTDFSASQGSSSVKFGSVVATVNSWSNTTITVLVPAGSVTSNIVVTVNLKQSNGKLFKVLGTVAPSVSFAADVLPLFTTTYGCTGCHGGQNNLFLVSYTQVMAGNSNNGPVIIAGNASASILVQKLRTTTVPFGARMPQGAAAVSDGDLQKIVDWINQGAKNN